MSTELTGLEERREQNSPNIKELLITLDSLPRDTTLRTQLRQPARQRMQFSCSDTSEYEDGTAPGERSRRAKKQPVTSYDEVVRYKTSVLEERVRKETDTAMDTGNASSEQGKETRKAPEKTSPTEADPPNLNCPLLILHIADESLAAEATAGQHQNERYPHDLDTSNMSYTEDLSDDDDYVIHCEGCGDWFRGDCANCGPLQPLNSELLGSKPGRSFYTTLPIPPEISIRQSLNEEAGLGAFSEAFIPKGTRFGPYTGEVLNELDLNPERDTSYMWEVTCSSTGKKLVDGKSEKFANWMRFVNCACDVDEQNLVAYQYKGEIYYRTFRDIPPHVELLVWYGKEYALDLGISSEDAALLHTTEVNPSEEDDSAVASSPVQRSNPQPDSTVQLRRRHARARVSLPGLVRVPRSLRANRTPSRHVSAPHGDVTRTDGTGDDDSHRAPAAAAVEGQHPARHAVVRKRRNWQMAGVTLPKVFKCKVCGRVDEAREDHIQHLRVHLSQYPHQCGDCGEIFQFRSGLRRHLYIHTGEKPYKCEVCGEGFRCNSHRTTHTRMHTGEKPYKCKLCGEAFNRRTHLRSHTRIHTGEKPYVCKTCGEAFRNSSNLVVHTRTHTGEKPYKCKICGEAFCDSGNLTQHIRKHTGEKPQKCKLCGQAFRDKRSLERHARKHSEEPPYE